MSAHQHEVYSHRDGDGFRCRCGVRREWPATEARPTWGEDGLRACASCARPTLAGAELCPRCAALALAKGGGA